MFKKLMIVTAASTLLSLGSGAVQAERYVLKAGARTNVPVAHQDRRAVRARDHRRHDGRDHRSHKGRHRFHNPPRRYAPRHGYRHYGHRPDLWWKHRQPRYRHHNHRHAPRYYRSRLGHHFPGYGLIRYGHRHSRHCPHWHSDAFVAGLIFGTVFNE